MLNTHAFAFLPFLLGNNPTYPNLLALLLQRHADVGLALAGEHCAVVRLRTAAARAALVHLPDRRAECPLDHAANVRDAGHAHAAWAALAAPVA